MAARTALSRTKTLDPLLPEHAANRKTVDRVQEVVASTQTLYQGVPMYGYGNSWMDDQYWFPRLVRKLGLVYTSNKATGGYRMQDTAITALSPGAKTWTPNTPGMVIVNDLGNNMGDPDDTANRQTALESMRALLAVLSSSSKVENTAFTFGTGWTQGQEFDGASGGTHAMTTTSGAFLDIAIPASGTYYLNCFGGNGIDFVTGIITVTQGSRTVAAVDTNQKARKTVYRAGLGIAPVAIRLENLAAGTIRVTHTNAGRTGTVYGSVDCLLQQMPVPPTVLVNKPVNVLDAAYINKPDLLNFLRSIPDTVATEFPNVVVCDPLPGWDANTMLGPDLLHPNLIGSEHIANNVTSALINASIRRNNAINLKSFGAKGDNIADDSAAISKAYAAAQATGRPIYIPGGTYKVTSWPDMANGTRFFGDGNWKSTIQFDTANATLMTLVNKQNITFSDMQFFITGAGSRIMELSNSFRFTFDQVVFRGNYAGDNAATYKGQIGVAITNNTGAAFFTNCDFNNLGIGVQTTGIQNEATSCKWATCYIGVQGVSVSNQPSSGFQFVNCEFVGADGLRNTSCHISIEGPADTWIVDTCWFEKADTGIRVGTVDSGGPALFSVTNSKIGVNEAGIRLNNCRQPALVNTKFDRDQAAVASPVEVVIPTINGTYGAQCIEGVAFNLVTTLRDDFQFGDFPQYWAHVRKGNAAFGNLRSRSNIDADGRVTASSFAVTYLPGALRVLQSDAAGLLTPVHKQTDLSWDSEMPMTAGTIAAGYTGYGDAIGGVAVVNPYNAAGVFLDSITFRLDDWTQVVGGSGNLQIQFYSGSPTAGESNLVATMQVPAGQNGGTWVLATPVAIAHNAVLRAKITSGTATLPGPARCHWRGRYQ